MKIVIRNYLSGSYMLESEPGKWDAIVVIDSRLHESNFVADHCPRHLYLRFDDVTTPATDKCPPTMDDVSAAVEFANGSMNLMVCCRAGQSRSAALAFVIAYQKLGRESALELLNPKRHSPNALVLEIAAQLIDEPSFVDAYRNWIAANSRTSGRTTLTDYLDEIETEYDNLEAAGARNRITES